MALDPTTKLAGVREAMAAEDWERAIILVAKLRSLGKYQKPIDRAQDFINNPRMYEQMGYDRQQVIDEAITAIKQKFSKSWEAVQPEKPAAGGGAGSDANPASSS
jgi:hypothetical protein